LWDEALISSKGDEEKTAGTEFENYAKYSEPIKRIPPHRLLAVNRGETQEILKVKLEISPDTLDKVKHKLRRYVIKNPKSIYVDILEDVIIENKQAIEMANIYSNILSGTMDAFTSLISNNLNIVMKFLASVTIVMSIPTMIASFFGMNVNVPFANSHFGFGIVLLITVFVAGIVAFILAKKDMF
jgi:Mg2+ and Co2+ transporter CorA